MTHVNSGQYAWKARKKGHRAHVIGPNGKTLCKAENGGRQFDMVDGEPPQGRRLCINCLSIRDREFRADRSSLDYQRMPIGEFETEDGGCMKVALCDHGQGRRISLQRLSRGGCVTKDMSFEPADGEALVKFLSTAVATAGRLETPYPEFDTPPWED